MDDWRKAITNAYKKALDEAMEKSFSFKEEFQERSFGVYGFRIFGPTYTFNVALSLPGALVKSNATQQDGNRLTWAFTRDHFYLTDHVLRASSRLVFPERIAAGAAALVVVLLIARFSSATSERNPDRSFATWIGISALTTRKEGREITTSLRRETRAAVWYSSMSNEARSAIS